MFGLPISQINELEYSRRHKGQHLAEINLSRIDPDGRSPASPTSLVPTAPRPPRNQPTSDGIATTKRPAVSLSPAKARRRKSNRGSTHNESSPDRQRRPRTAIAQALIASPQLEQLTSPPATAVRRLCPRPRMDTASRRLTTSSTLPAKACDRDLTVVGLEAPSQASRSLAAGLLILALRSRRPDRSAQGPKPLCCATTPTGSAETFTTLMRFHVLLRHTPRR